MLVYGYFIVTLPYYFIVLIYVGIIIAMVMQYPFLIYYLDFLIKIGIPIEGGNLFPENLIDNLLIPI